MRFMCAHASSRMSCAWSMCVARARGCGTCCGRRDLSLGCLCHCALSLDTIDCRARVDLRTLFGHDSCGAGVAKECYLVDPASSHMLVSKIKPCMCKYELIQTVKLRMAH